MRYALDQSGDRVEATYSGQKAICPYCRTAVTAHCGAVKVDHWHHVSKSDCIGCYTEMTPWHRDWQDEFPVDCREKRIKAADDSHRQYHFADVLVAGTVIEFQHSSITGKEVQSREATYAPTLVWVLDVTEGNVRIDGSRWYAVTSTLGKFAVLCRSPIFLDMGRERGLVHVARFDSTGAFPEGVAGDQLSRFDFIQLATAGRLLKEFPPHERKEKTKRKRQATTNKRQWMDGEEGETCWKPRVDTSSVAAPARPYVAPGQRRLTSRLSRSVTITPAASKPEKCKHEQLVTCPHPNRKGKLMTFCQQCRRWIR